MPDSQAAKLISCLEMLAALAFVLIDQGSSHSWEEASGCQGASEIILLKSVQADLDFSLLIVRKTFTSFLKKIFRKAFEPCLGGQASVMFLSANVFRRGLKIY